MRRLFIYSYRTTRSRLSSHDSISYYICPVSRAEWQNILCVVNDDLRKSGKNLLLDAFSNVFVLFYSLQKMF